MQGAFDDRDQKAELQYLPEFANYILKDHYDEFLKISLQLLRELKVPLLLAMSETDAEALANKSNLELLTALTDKNPSVHIRKAIERWEAHQFPVSKQNKLVVDDVTRIGYARKLAFLKLMPGFTHDTQVIMDLVREIDAYLLEYTATTLHNFVSIMDERLNQHVQKLEESEKLYKQAETIAHIGNWKWEVTQNLVLWTDELYRIHGLEPQSQQIDLELYLSFAHEDDREMITSTISESLQTGKPFEFFHRIVTRDKKVKIIHSKGQVLKDDNGHPYQLLGSAQDVTTQKEIENQLIENQQVLLHRTQELQQSNASLEEFAYVASHDLKEPLRKISIFIERLSSLRAKCTPAEAQFMDKISSSVGRMRDMINDLLSLSLISANKKPEKYSLSKLLAEVLQTFETRLEECGAVVEATPLPEGYVVPSQFAQLFQNLIGNSLKFVKKGEKTLIKVTWQYLKPADVASHNLPPARQYLQIIFADNGIGFNNAFADKIFAVFQRLHQKHEYEGTGIGLAICRKIVKNHGGIILASGVPNQGATFKIIIPA